MKPLTLDEIKQIEFQLLKKFDAFCRQHGIQYFLSNGTLLGAVKYKGFIPWDDDIDVLVPREDYDRLIALYEDDEQYRLMSFEREPKYLFPFAKFCDMSTLKEEHNINNGVSLGLNIDVFPLDLWADTLPEAEQEVGIIRKNISGLSLTKLQRPNASTAVKRLAQRVLMAAARLRPAEYYLKEIDQVCMPQKGRTGTYMGCKCWCIYGTREIIPAEVFESTVEVMFEGAVFPAPSGYDVYLRSLYGDYRQDPPPEKQKTHHGFTAYRR